MGGRKAWVTSVLFFREGESPDPTYTHRETHARALVMTHFNTLYIFMGDRIKKGQGAFVVSSQGPPPFSSEFPRIVHISKYLWPGSEAPTDPLLLPNPAL